MDEFVSLFPESTALKKFLKIWRKNVLHKWKIKEQTLTDYSYSWEI